MRTAIDTNVISGLWSSGPIASEMVALLGNIQDEGGLVVCRPVYAELLAHLKATEQFVDEFLSTTAIMVDYDLSEEVWREAGRRFAAYSERRRQSHGSNPKRLLVDFLIGAHALLCADRLLTLDRDR